MTEKGYKGGLMSRVCNKYSRKKYVISTAQEIGQDYWTSTIFPGILFGLLPKLSKKMYTVVRNSKESAHDVHSKMKELAFNLPENEWFEKMPNPQPEEGWSPDAKKKLGEM